MGAAEEEEEEEAEAEVANGANGREVEDAECKGTEAVMGNFANAKVGADERVEVGTEL